MEIMNEIRNELLKRTEVQFVIQSDSNPGFENSKKAVAEKFRVSEDNIAVKFVKSNFGTHDFFVEAFVYDSPKDKERIEQKKKEKKAKAGAAK